MSDYLSHYGVKGMKWGVRRDENTLNRLAGRRMAPVGGTRSERKALKTQAKADWQKFKSGTTSKERRGLREEARRTLADHIINDAINNADSRVVITTDPYGNRLMLSGKEFVTHLGNGGAFNPLTTSIHEIPKDRS